MSAQGFVTHTEYQKHIRGEWRTVHNLWPHIRKYVPGWGYSKAEIDAMFAGTQGSVAFADAGGFIAEDNANFFWDAANLRLGIGTPTPDVAVDIEFDAVATVVSRVSAQTRPWRHWECVSGNWGLAIGIDANDGIIHFNYDAPIGTMNTIMMVFDGPNVRVGILDSTPTYPLDVGGNTNIQGTFRVTGAATLLGALAVTGLLSNTGGAKLEIQGGVNGGSTRGIFLWDTSSTSWGIYVSESGAGKSLADGVACTNFAGDTGHHIRFRISDTAGRAFVWENSSETCLMDLEGDTGNLTILGDFSLRSSKELRFYDNGNYVGFKAPALGADFIWALPATDGPANEALATDNAGNLIWRTHDELAGFEIGEHFTMLDEDDLASDSDTQAATQQSIKAYVDAQVAAINEFIELTDTPAAYAGHGNETLRVNFAEDAIEFYVQTDQYVKVDAAGAPGFLGVAAGDGVLRTTANITVTDGGNFITLDTVQDIGTGDSPTFAGLTVTDYIYFDKDVEHVMTIGYQCGNALAGGGTYNYFMGEQAGYSVTTGDYNIAIGYQALYYATLADKNVAIGYQALMGTIGQTAAVGNFALGFEALKHCYGTANVAIGSEAGENITTGSYNMLIGNAAGKGTGTASRNVAIGAGALSGSPGNENIGIGFECARIISGGYYNVLIGALAAYDLTSGHDNVAIGRYTHLRNKTGDENVVIGCRAGLGVSNNSHDANTFIGYEAGFAITTGGTNVCIGKQAGKSITSGVGNVCLGYMAGETNLTVGNNQLWIANSNTATPLIYGEFDNGFITINGYLNITTMKSGATQVAAGAVAGELWYTAGHATLLDNIVMMGV